MNNIETKSNEEMKPHVGMTVWIFDENRRIYPARKLGESYLGRGLIWREHWSKREIVGETSKSWLIGFTIQSAIKHPKKDFPNRFGVLLTEEDVIKAAWIHDNCIQIADLVRRCRDHQVMKQIAAIIGYVEQP